MIGSEITFFEYLNLLLHDQVLSVFCFSANYKFSAKNPSPTSDSPDTKSVNLELPY